MLLLHLIVILTTGQVWFEGVLPSLHLNPNLDYILPAVWSAAQSYIFLFIPVAIWHFADLLQSDREQRRWRKLLCGYRWFAICFVAYGAAALFHQSIWLNDLGCPKPQPFQFDGCGSWTPWWKTVIAIFPLSGLGASAIAKLTLAIFDLLRVGIDAQSTSAVR